MYNKQIIKAQLIKNGILLINTECEAGFYGPNCTAPCSEYCKNNMCDRTSGTCLEGCMNGYTGDHCNESKRKLVLLLLNIT